jgi:hypothetical protein
VVPGVRVARPRPGAVAHRACRCGGLRDVGRHRGHSGAGSTRT